MFTAAPARAAPTLLTLRTGAVTEAQTAATLDRFARFNAVRAMGIALTVIATVSALISAVD